MTVCFITIDFSQLTSKAGNMLSDHMAKAYYEGLLEVKAVRAAKQDLPHWVGFADDCTCACCASLFTWASTSNSEAQAARDKHNCRACGGLVCDPCSKKRIPIPAIGITAPVRVCDRCYNGWGAMYGDLEVRHESDYNGALDRYSERPTSRDDTKYPGARDRALRIVSYIGRMDREEDKRRSSSGRARVEKKRNGDAAAGDDDGEGDSDFDPWASVKRYL